MLQHLFRVNLRTMSSVKKSKQSLATNKSKIKKNRTQIPQITEAMKVDNNINSITEKLEVNGKAGRKANNDEILDMEEMSSSTYAKTRLRTKKKSDELEKGGKMHNNPSVIDLKQLDEEPEKVVNSKKPKGINELTGASSSKKIKKETDEVNWEPKDWREILENIRLMRSKDNAPVDTMGCHKCADENADEKTQRFHKLVALMLSSQTKDETTYHAMLRLKEQTLIPETIVNMKLNTLENMLHPVSFYKNKAKYLQQTSKILVENYGSDIPNNIKDLVALPGVGPKMAHICMSTAWQQVTGIGVDVHVHRICNRLNWVPKATKEPEQTRLALEAWLPQQLWGEVNHLLVGFGQTVCTPAKPKCENCLNNNICPSAPKSAKNINKNENNEINPQLAELLNKAEFKKSKTILKNC
uniref:Endonuclease III homolog n=1 Tax=Glossina palpalis gambiensis TaxID=67801 RepID=A0A1B0BLX9_9MUSC